MSTRANTMRRMRWSSAGAALRITVPLFLSSAIPVQAQQHPVAPGWYAVSTVPEEYRIGIEPVRRPGSEGFVGATLRGFVEAPYASGILLQSIRADEYRGRRIRLTSWLRTAGESPDTAMTEARLWMRVDGANGPLWSDYMLDRPILGIRDWALYAVVLDVPRAAIGISFGVAMTGRGQLWLDDVSFETVGKEVALTGQPRRARHADSVASRASRVELVELRRADRWAYGLAPMRPTNLDFEQALIAVR